MICLFCEDVTARAAYQHYYRNRGILIESPPPMDFIQRTEDEDVDAVLFVGKYDRNLATQIPERVAVFAVCEGASEKMEQNATGNITGDVTGDVTGNAIGDVTGDIIFYKSYDDPGLLKALLNISGNYNRYSYRNLLYSNDEKVYFLGYEFDLTPTERAILGYFVRNSQREVGAEELLKFCVGDEYRKRTNVSQHISRINLKAMAAGGRQMIESSNAGSYRLRKYF